MNTMELVVEHRPAIKGAYVENSHNVSTLEPFLSCLLPNLGPRVVAFIVMVSPPYTSEDHFVRTHSLSTSLKVLLIYIFALQKQIEEL
jgi:hypothetical protein